jgi:PEP-CTERM motif-containing protein
MRRVLMTALAGAAMAAASPAYADPPGGVAGGVVDACTAVYVQNAIACQGYYGGNLFQGAAGSATPADIQSVITLLLNGTASTADTLPTNNTAAYAPPYVINTSTVLATLENQNGTNGVPFNYVFGGPNLSGLVVFGAHFGTNPDAGEANNISALWLVNVGAGPTHTITVTNGQGVSNAQIFGFGGAVPEPATWAMMLLGFGGIGMAMRRRKANGRLLQIA